jgi:hypothetical protein
MKNIKDKLINIDEKILNNSSNDLLNDEYHGTEIFKL